MDLDAAKASLPGQVSGAIARQRRHDEPVGKGQVLWGPRMLSSLVTWKIKDQAREPIPARTTGIARQSETRMPGSLLALTPTPLRPGRRHHCIMMC